MLHVRHYADVHYVLHTFRQSMGGLWKEMHQQDDGVVRALLGMVQFKMLISLIDTSLNCSSSREAVLHL
jgi:hypothetical protein